MATMLLGQIADVSFYAELTRKGGKRAGTVIVVNHAKLNGRCFAAIAVPTGAIAGKNALPVVTWTSPEYLANKCQKVSEAEAREIDPAMMTFLDKYNRSAEFRAMYHAEEMKPGRSSLQRASDVEGPSYGETWVGHKFYELYGA